MKVLIDTNVVLDVLLDRMPHNRSAVRIFSFVEEAVVEGFLCATTVTTIDYLLGQALNRQDARNALRRILDIFEIAPVNRPVIEQAFRSNITDFEDAVVEQSAKIVGVDAVVTRDVNDRKSAAITVYDPAELISVIESVESANESSENDASPST